MKHLKEQILEAAKVDTVLTLDDVGKFFKETKDMDWKHDDSITKTAIYNGKWPKEQYSSINLVINVKEQKNYVSGAIYTSSGADKWPYYIKILDSFDKHPNNKKLFDALTKAGFKEANNGRCAQWGTWKFFIGSKSDLDVITDLIKNIIK